jgi:hypothetical protein
MAATGIGGCAGRLCTGSAVEAPLQQQRKQQAQLGAQFGASMSVCYFNHHFSYTSASHKAWTCFFIPHCHARNMWHSTMVHMLAHGERVLRFIAARALVHAATVICMQLYCAWREHQEQLRRKTCFTVTTNICMRVGVVYFISV